MRHSILFVGTRYVSLEPEPLELRSLDRSLRPSTTGKRADAEGGISEWTSKEIVSQTDS